MRRPPRGITEETGPETKVNRKRRENRERGSETRAKQERGCRGGV